jgi:myo-inositol-1(or 4)-monophosphatase
METFLAQPNSLSQLTLIATEAALQAGNLLKEGFGTSFSIGHKEGHHNLVTEYDTRAEKLLIDFLSSQVPGSQFIGEEGGAHGDLKAPYLWIIDPLDGTVNFAHQIPFFCVSIGVMKRGELIAGVIYDPLSHELFVAEKGKGAFLDGKKISVTQTKELSASFVATGFPYNTAEHPQCLANFVDIMQRGVSTRDLGSAALSFAYLAAGRLDAFFEASLSPWDCAAGQILVQEAAGLVTHWDGVPFDLFSKRPLLASNRPLHPILSQVLSRK